MKKEGAEEERKGEASRKGSVKEEKGREWEELEKGKRRVKG